MTHKLHPVSVLQAAEDSPTLARLAELARDSGERLKAVESLIPPTLRSCIKPGPIDGGDWCLLVEGNAAAAKLRQVLPALQTKLNSLGWQVSGIRIKVQARTR
ncbi:MAG TPA: DciA family protein [Ramlibacter sp.]|jgi:hypothetical protein|uniref:DciA family protein n=1 Tax=Ramlibacter sp. TaxID=1917967 RepID=UPI002D2DB762|nr:DciA family protein [Ramlibacter sp.]HZY20137.1 DciA family protein [Ramlibacter sp.]